MKKISLLALVAAFALVGAGCTASFDVEDRIEDSGDVVEEVMEDGESEEDEGINEDMVEEVVEGVVSEDGMTTVYTGEWTISGTYSSSAGICSLRFAVDSTETEKLPGDPQEGESFICVSNTDVIPGYTIDPDSEGQLTLRIDEVRVVENDLELPVWWLEVAEVME